MIMVLRQGKTLHSHTLNSLYSAFRFTETNSSERVVAEQDALNHASGSNVSLNIVQTSLPTGTAFLSSESKHITSMKKIMADIYESNMLSEITTECDETGNDDLMCMVAKTFNCFKARSKRSFGPNASGSNSVDKTNLTCFKCGKKGHFMKECRSSQASTSGPSHPF